MNPIAWLLAVLAVSTLPAAPQTESKQRPERLPPSLANSKPLAVGERYPLNRGVLFVPEGYEVPRSGDVPVFIHFQGGVRIAEENFARMKRPGVLIASTLAGRSSAFSKPYKDAKEFRSLLEMAAQRLGAKSEARVRLTPITITSFSAGYGAVRELLAVPEFYSRIDNLVMADSIYASIVAPDVRAPRVEQMADFARFAQAAARREKTFVLTHSAIPTDYASTAECANFLLASVAAERQQVKGRFSARGVPIAAEAHVGGFHLYSFSETDARIHMDCLYMIPDLVRRHISTESEAVRKIFAGMRTNVGPPRRMGFPKNLGWQHLPALFDFVDSAQLLKRFPVNSISSQLQPRCQEGMMALWLIEGIRKHPRPAFASLNPLCLSKDIRTDWNRDSERNHPAAANLYRRWWDDLASRSEAAGRREKPLANSSLHWH